VCKLVVNVNKQLVVLNWALLDSKVDFGVQNGTGLSGGVQAGRGKRQVQPNVALVHKLWCSCWSRGQQGGLGVQTGQTGLGVQLVIKRQQTTGGAQLGAAGQQGRLGVQTGSGGLSGGCSKPGEESDKFNPVYNFCSLN